VTVIIAHSATGLGHRSVANAIAEELAALRPRWCVSVVDAFVDLDVPILRRSSGVYASLTQGHTPVYDALWRMTNNRFVRALGVGFVSSAGKRRIAELIYDHEPDLFVSTHPLLLADVVGRASRNGGVRPLIVTVVTDLSTIHRSWISAHSDRYVVFTSQAEAALRAEGVRRQHVARAAFPVAAAYRRPLGREQARRNLGIGSPKRYVVLLTGGGAGTGSILETAHIVKQEMPAAALFVAVGSNIGLARAVTRLGAHVVSADTPNLATQMSAADLVVSKAGSSTIFECAAIGVPLIITDEVGLQERGNAALATELGIARVARDSGSLREALRIARTNAPQRVNLPASPGGGVGELLADWQAERRDGHSADV
jgi:UDP-N-acetylglucosamine:LPS N-acetylglucosamine transferase